MNNCRLDGKVWLYPSENGSPSKATRRAAEYVLKREGFEVVKADSEGI